MTKAYQPLFLMLRAETATDGDIYDAVRLH